MAVSNKLTDTKASKLEGESSDSEGESSNDIQKHAIHALERCLRTGQAMSDSELRSMLIGLFNDLRPTSVHKLSDRLYQYGFIPAPVELDPDHTLKRKIQIIQEHMNQQKFCNILACIRQIPEIKDVYNKFYQ